MKKDFETWVHVKITDKDLAEKLDAISEADNRDRSKTVRFLIEQEWKRREKAVVTTEIKAVAG